MRKAAAARARASKSQKKIVSDAELTFPDSAIEQSEEFECTGWTGGVNYVLSDTDMDMDTKSR